MIKQPAVISRGPLRGKKIEFASTSGVDAFRGISEDFMKKIFGLDYEEYLITDGSRLRDFVGIDDTDLTDIHDKVQTAYGLDVSKLRSGNLLTLLKRIRRQKSLHRTADSHR